MINPELFQSILNNLDTGILVFDRNGKIHSWNPRLKLLLGLDDHFPGPNYQIETFRFWLSRELALAESNQHNDLALAGQYWIGTELLARNLSAMQKGIPGSFMVQLSSGKVIEIQGLPVPDGGFSLTIRDCTETETLRHKLKLSKDRLAQTGAVQDRVMETTGRVLQQSLQQIIGSASQLNLHSDSDQDKHLIDNDFRVGSSDQVLDALNTILDFVAVGANKMELSKDIFDLQAVCLAIARQHPTTQKRDILPAFSVGMEKIRSVMLFGDAGRLRQLVALLVERMRQYSLNGAIDLRFDMSEETAGHVLFRTHISARGDGLTRESNERMRELIDGSFDAQNIQNATQHDLGLIVARSILKAMNAEMTVRADKPGQMDIRIEIMFVKSGDVALQSWQDTGHVVILDTDQARSSDIARWLNARKYECHIVSDVVSLMRVCQSLFGQSVSPDGIVIYDEYLGQDTGTDIARSIESLYDQYSIVDAAPLLLVSPIGLRGENARLIQAGYLGHLNGNVGLSALIFAIRAIRHQACLPANKRLFVTRFSLAENLGKDFMALVVDDNAVNRDIASAIMEKAGFIVETAKDGNEAVQKCKQQYYDIVLMDISMPEMDGVTATQAIRQISYHHANMPVIAVTSNSQPEEAAHYERSGLNGLVAKPVESNRLSTMASDLLSLRILGKQGTVFAGQVSIVKTTGLPEREALQKNTEENDDDSFLEGVQNMAGDGDIVNIALLSGLRSDLGDEILKELIGAFLGDIDNHRQALSTAVSEQNLEKLEIAAHTIKGMAGNLGIDRVFHMSQEVVSLCRQSRTDEAISTTDTLQTQITEAVDYIDNLDLAAL